MAPAPDASSAGSRARVTCTRPITLTSYIWRHSSLTASATGPEPNAPPALLTSTSRRSPTAAARAAADSSEVTSVATAVPPISSATAPIRSTGRAARKTWKPASASRRAVAAPIPLLAPVTTAVLMAVILHRRPPGPATGVRRSARGGVRECIGYRGGCGPGEAQDKEVVRGVGQASGDDQPAHLPTRPAGHR